MGFEPFALDVALPTGRAQYGVGLTQHGLGSLVVRVVFADLGGPTDHWGKVCFDATIGPSGGFRTCTGTDHFCPTSPPPPNSPPPGVTGPHIILDIAATAITAERIQLGLINEIHVIESAANGVVGAMNDRLMPAGGGPPLYKSFHVYQVLEVISEGGLPAAGLANKFLAVPVHGAGVTP